jgi:hypothetical protein
VKYLILGISNNVYEEFEDNKGGESVNQRRPVNMKYGWISSQTNVPLISKGLTKNLRYGI